MTTDGKGEKETLELTLEGKTLVVEGRLRRVSHVDGDGYKLLADPESAIAWRGPNSRADLLVSVPTGTVVSRPTTWHSSLG